MQPLNTGTINKQYVTAYGHCVQIITGDIYSEKVDAIVNSEANKHLAHGGSLLLKRAGPEIQQESSKWTKVHGPVQIGNVAITSSGKLPCKYIIHAVGPVWTGGKKGEKIRLRDAIYNSLEAAHKHKLSSISLPAITSGLYGYPNGFCAEIYWETVLEWTKLRKKDTTLKLIRFVNDNPENIKQYVMEYEKRFPVPIPVKSKNTTTENRNAQPIKKQERINSQSSQSSTQDSQQQPVKKLRYEPQKKGMKRKAETESPNKRIKRQINDSQQIGVAQGPMQLTGESQFEVRSQFDKMVLSSQMDGGDAMSISTSLAYTAYENEVEEEEASGSVFAKKNEFKMELTLNKDGWDESSQL